MANYDKFSKHYDLLMGDPIDRVATLKQFIKKQTPQAKTLLELACGTGTVLKHFKQDFAITGLDLSAGMLKVATQKLKGTKLVQGDMRTFSLPNQFDVILCIFDSINHLLKISDWDKTFKQVKKHLNPNGVFIFDTNTKYWLEKVSNSQAWLKPLGKDFCSIKVEKEKNEIYNWKVRVFEHKAGDNYKLMEENIREVAFSQEKVEKVLKKYFGKVTTSTYITKKPTKTSGKFVFICTI